MKTGGSPVIAYNRSSPTSACHQSACSWVRLSYQAITGYTGRPSLSTGTPASAMPVMARPATWWFSRSADVTSRRIDVTRSHTSSGSK